jgi:hypothetical protein
MVEELLDHATFVLAKREDGAAGGEVVEGL